MVIVDRNRGYRVLWFVIDAFGKIRWKVSRPRSSPSAKALSKVAMGACERSRRK